ncbi:MAG TPA: amidohydrolase [Acidimicrobiaceae bacterium]|jgi:amidohydrolase|nr:amidohydrolase [Acidimicrobiaceae bacterium]
MSTRLTTMLAEQVQPVIAEVRELRRNIHQHPELGTDNPHTQQLILDALEGLGLDIQVGTSITSVVADLVGGLPGPTVLLRADTDALPMLEESGEPFSSTIAGRAHACGHDAHVAMLVGAARVLTAERDSLRGRVRFIFQPGEEGFGGAVNMIDEGALEGVDYAFAIHVSPNVPTGMVAGKGGPIMAATDTFEARILGKGAHASTPHFGNDPIPVACEAVSALQTMVTRRIDAFNPAVITVGRISGGTTNNVIPESVELEGTVRTVSEGARLAATTGLERIIRGVCQAHDCSVELSMTPGYPVTVNDMRFASLAAEVVTEVLGEGSYFELPTPIMGAEDFSYILQQVPGAMVFLGACPEGIQNSLEAPSCHSNLMRINEDALENGVALHVAMARAVLQGRFIEGSEHLVETG